MSELLVPSDVAALLRVRGLRAVSTVGDDGTGWLAVPSGGPPERSGDVADGWPGAAAVDVLLLSAPPDEALMRRASAWAGIVHQHVQELLEVRALDVARTAVLVRHVPGSPLDALRAGRWPLTDAEGATVAIGLARALDALHAAGLTHGAVTGCRAVVRDDGVPVLVDPRRALTGEGTPGGDVAALVATVLAVLPGPDADLPVTAGVPTLRQGLLALSRAGCQRAAEVEQVCFATTTPEPVALPDAGSRAAASLLLADRSALPRRARRPRRRWPVVAAATLTMLAVAAPAAERWASAGEPAAAPVAGPTGVAPPQSALDLVGPATAARAHLALADHADPAAAAAALTVLRGHLLADPSAAELTAVEIDDGPALGADREVLASLAGTVRIGLQVRVRSAALVARPTPDEAVVRVVSSIGAHVVRGPDGTTRPRAAGADRAVDLTLRWTDDGWRVWGVSAPSA